MKQMMQDLIIAMKMLTGEQSLIQMTEVMKKITDVTDNIVNGKQNTESDAEIHDNVGDETIEEISK